MNGTRHPAMLKHKKTSKFVKKSGVALEKDSTVKSCNGHSDRGNGAGLVDEATSQGVQLQILEELKRMSARLEEKDKSGTSRASTSRTRQRDKS